MRKIAIALLSMVAIVLVLASGFLIPFKYQDIYNNLSQVSTITLPEPFKVIHLKTPDSVRALYMTNWVAGNKKLRNNLVNIIDASELNSIVIDIKDYTGRIGFLVEDEELKRVGSAINRVPDMKEFIGELHEKGIYVIGRISVFQDSYLVHKKSEYAVKTNSGEIWKDNKGVSWLDVGAKPVWEYIALIGEEAYALGFDELNFDYIRFPSDGNMKDISYPYSLDKNKAETLKEFFVFIDKRFRTKGITISADLFGMTTTNNDDLGIGQILENALIHFDFVAPMVYPSHYPSNFLGYKTPAEKPYEVISYVMSKGIEKAKMASSSPLKLRPWLQDFSIGKTKYTSEMIKDQIRATYDVGLNSWMIWNASNVYTVSALEPDIK